MCLNPRLILFPLWFKTSTLTFRKTLLRRQKSHEMFWIIWNCLACLRLSLTSFHGPGAARPTPTARVWLRSSGAGPGAVFFLWPGGVVQERAAADLGRLLKKVRMNSMYASLGSPLSLDTECFTRVVMVLNCLKEYKNIFCHYQSHVVKSQILISKALVNYKRFLKT